MDTNNSPPLTVSPGEIAPYPGDWLKWVNPDTGLVEWLDVTTTATPKGVTRVTRLNKPQKGQRP